MNILERIKKLEEAIEEWQIIDSEDIIAEDTGMCIVLHLEDPTVDAAESGNYYTGFFRIVADDEKENTINIVDGTDTLGENCGIYVFGIDKIEVKETSLTITAESYIMLYATYNAEEKKWTIEIKAESSLPDFTEDKFAALLGVVKWNSEDPENEKMGQIVQIWNNGIIYNNRYS